MGSGRRRWIVPLLVGSLLAAACSSEESGSSPSGGSGSGGGEPGASDVGITEDTISVAYLQPDLEVVAEAGFAELIENPELAVEALVADVNEQGGIHGRTLEVNTYEYDPTQIPAALIGACTQAGQDDPNFLAFSFAFFGDGLTCLAGDEGVPTLTASSLAGTVYDRADGNAFLFNDTFEGHQRALVAGLDASGALDGLTLGAMNRDEPGASEALDDGLRPALEDAGLTLAESAVITGSIMGDPASISAAVQGFKEAGVDGVFLLGNVFVSGNFLAEAERQGYTPTYFASDQSEVTSSLVVNFAPTSQLGSARGVSWKRQGETVTGQAPSEADERCREIRDRLSPPLSEQGSTTYDAYMQICTMFTVMVQALEDAGENPTRADFVEAMEGIGEFDLGTGSTGSFGPDDHTAPTAVRPVEFQVDCGCWVPTGDWVPTS